MRQDRNSGAQVAGCEWLRIVEYRLLRRAGRHRSPPDVSAAQAKSLSEATNSHDPSWVGDQRSRPYAFSTPALNPAFSHFEYGAGHY